MRQDLRTPAKAARRLLIAAGAALLLQGSGNLALSAAEETATLETAAKTSADACLSVNDIRVQVSGLRSLDGLVTFELYNDDPESFIKKSGLLVRLRVAVGETGAEACLKAPGPGTYAVVLYHDENANEKFDKGFLGIPTEGFGFSNNPGIGIGAPDHEEAAFPVDGQPVALKIEMNYL